MQSFFFLFVLSSFPDSIKTINAGSYITYIVINIFKILILKFICLLAARRGVKGVSDAPVVERMKSAGAILIAVSNVSGRPRIILGIFY